MDLIRLGWQLVFSPSVVLLVGVGCLLGLLIGVLPGLGPLMGIILLLPLTFYLSPEAAMGLLVAIYVGGSCGGAVSAILLRVPGTPLAAATLLDGYPMARKGRAQDAVGLAVGASSLGGTISGVILLFFAPVLAGVALNFGPPEYFALSLSGIILIALVAQGAVIKGIITGLLGMLLATIGTDEFTNAYRFTFGMHGLTGGFNIVPLVLGLFALSEIAIQLEEGEFKLVPKVGRIGMPLRSTLLLFKHKMNLVRSSLIGTVIGIIPGAGGVISSFAAYAVAKVLRRPHEKFGQGAEGGVVASESANNACCGGALIPTLALGIPGDASTAVLMAALLLFGVFSGPELFEVNRDLAGGIILSYLLANIFLFFFGVIFAPVFTKVIKVRKFYRLAAVLLLSVIGAYGVQSSIFDLWVMVGFALVGYFLRKRGYPLSPMVIGVVLGPICENNFRRSLLFSDQGWLIFFTRPISATVLAINVVLIVLVAISGWVALRRARKEEQEELVHANIPDLH